ncbi:meprin A subunit beta-like [Xenentodon cancila]
MNAKGVILRAFDSFRLKSCINFKPRASEDFYIVIRNLNKCSSFVGKKEANGQELSIGKNCDQVYIVEHEILHALGFFHEQSRYDRDDYVTIEFENILEGFNSTFQIESRENSTTQGVPYDYWSVMHYGKDAFTNGKGSTIVTKDPKFQDVIGQSLGMSPYDVLELNLLYKCNSTIAFQMHCSFPDGTACKMNRFSQSGIGWEVATHISGGPNSDHTNLTSGNGGHGQEAGYFMHASTASGQVGDSARLETETMSPKRDCHVQCLQFYYYHSGNDSDTLNIWIREFQDEQDSTGSLRLMGQITGPQTSHWKLQHVSLNATKNFQVVFEVRKGAGNSTGGFSIDDINLSETECPHVTLQIDNFEKLLNISGFGTRVYSPRQYTPDGYAYRVAVSLYQTYIGLNFQVVSGDYDDQLKWPCLQRQITFQMLDQNPNMQLQMSKQRSMTIDPHQAPDRVYYCENPRKTGDELVVENESMFAGPLVGFHTFASLEQMQLKDFLKGGSAVFVFSFQDLSPLVDGSTLPCPQLGSEKAAHLPRAPQDEGPSNFTPGTGAAPDFILLLTLMFLVL